MKLAIVGGGSTYTPELIDGFARHQKDLPLSEVALIDPDPLRLQLVGSMAQRMLRRAGHPAAVTLTEDVARGVAGADAVLAQLRVGGQEARRQDETWPHVAGCIGQETTGPGGLAKALRTVPVMLEVASAVRRYAASGAWLIDFTNPVGIVTRALLEEGHRAVGLCNVAIGFQRKFAAMLGAAPDEVLLGHFGLNHLTWETSVTVRGVDALPDLLDTHLEEIAAEIDLAASLVRELQMIPSYYLKYFYEHDAELLRQLAGPTRAEEVRALESDLLDLYADPDVDTKPAALEGRGGAYYSEAAIELLLMIAGAPSPPRVVNLQNNGTLPFLPDDHVIEVPATYREGQFIAEPVPPLPAEVTGLIAAVAAYERLALEAALRGGRGRVAKALLAHPLVLQWDRAEKLTDLLIERNADYLPWA